MNPPLKTYYRNLDKTYPALESIPQTIQEPIRIFPDDPRIEEPLPPEPSIPYGYQDTKDWSWR